MTRTARLAALLSAALLPFARPAFAAPYYEDVTVEKFPDADSVLVDACDEVAYNPDGSYVSRNESVTKILTEKGRREESVISLSYSTRYGSARIEGVFVTGPDGVEREVDVSATTKEATDNKSTSSNIYDPMHRKITCTVPGLKVGDVLRCRTARMMDRPRVQDSFSDMCMMEWTCPMLRQVFVVRAPAGRPLKRMAVRDPLGNVKYEAEDLPDGGKVHKWTATNSPQAFPEPDMPPMARQLQRVIVSTADSWPEFSRWYWELCRGHLEKTTPEITNRVESIVASLPDGEPDARRIAAVFKWVSQEVRYMGLTMEDTSPGYAPHDVNITFENRYGVCRDKAALLAAMLRIAGFEAFPVLIHAGAKMDEEVPSPWFNHAIVAVRAPGDPAANKDGFILMDPTNESSADLFPAYLGDKSYLVATPEGEPLHVSQVVPAADNAFSVDSKATLQRDGSMVVESVVGFKGYNDNVYRHVLLARKPEERRRLFENGVTAACAGAELMSFEFWPKDLRETESLLRVKLVYRVNEALLKGETRDELTVPFLTRVMSVVNSLLRDNMSLEKRRFPLVIDTTAMSDETVEIDLGGALGGKARLPDPVVIDGPCSFRREYAVSNGVLTARRTLAVNAVELSPDEYLAVREDQKRIEAADRPRPVFSKNPEAGANVRFRRIVSDYVLTSPTSWTVTNVVEKEILTYDGKKKSAELKFFFNPTWKNVEVLSATVTGKDGRTVAAGERETTMLDCGWAASAPRYPASRQLVVNLPSVEIGSVISYTTATTVKDSPLPFRSTWLFDVREPTDEIVVRVRMPDGKTWERTVKSPKMLPAEPMQPDAELWRDHHTISLGDLDVAAKNLRAAADVKPLKECEALDDAAKCRTPEDKIVAIRNWMSRHVRISGPTLYETPLALQLTDPATVVAERYCARLDYVRTLCALLRGAGFEADVVFAANDALEFAREAKYDEGAVDVGRFSHALCRVRVRKGGFLCWGGKTCEYFVGTENEYSPLGPSAYLGSHYLDPARGVGPKGARFEVGGMAMHFPAEDKTTYSMQVRENGTVDLDYEAEMYGPGVGSFRKSYSEILPEDRSRHFLSILNGLSHSASATSELRTDVRGYPAKMEFSAYLEKYATVSDDTITIVLPGIGGRLFPLTGSVRETAIETGASGKSETTIARVVFPEGYTEIEHLPSDYCFCPAQYAAEGGRPWFSLFVSTSKDAKGRLVVEVKEDSFSRAEALLPATDFALLKDWSRIASSRANRTIVVRKKGK